MRKSREGAVWFCVLGVYGDFMEAPSWGSAFPGEGKKWSENEGEQALVAASGADETGEAGGDGIGPERAHGRAVLFYVARNKIIPATVDDAPER